MGWMDSVSFCSGSWWLQSIDRDNENRYMRRREKVGSVTLRRRAQGGSRSMGLILLGILIGGALVLVVLSVVERPQANSNGAESTTTRAGTFLTVKEIEIGHDVNAENSLKVSCNDTAGPNGHIQ